MIVDGLSSGKRRRNLDGIVGVIISASCEHVINCRMTKPDITNKPNAVVGCVVLSVTRTVNLDWLC